MRKLRLLLFSALGLTLAAGLAIGLLLLPSVQTWLVKRKLAAHPEWGLSLETIRAKPGHVHVEGLRYNPAGVLLEVPSVDSDISLLPLLNGSYVFQSLVAKGWRLRLQPGVAANGSGQAARAGASVREQVDGILDQLLTMVSQPDAGGTQGQGARRFRGIFNSLRLPCDLEVADCHLAGELIFPAGEGWGEARTELQVDGYALRPGQPAYFTLSAQTEFGKGCPVESIQVQGDCKLRMDTPRSFSGIDCRLNALAKGTQIPSGASLDFDVRLERKEASESYGLTFLSGGRRALALSCAWEPSSKVLKGTWGVDCSDADIAPFSAGYRLPGFLARGVGAFERDIYADRLRLQGSLEGRLSSLEVFSHDLASLGGLRFSSDFDVSRLGSVLSVGVLRFSVLGSSPLCTIEAGQAFSFDVSSSKLQLSDPEAPFIRLGLEALPLAWVEVLVPGLSASGGPLSGRLLVFARETGFSVRTVSPLLSQGLRLAWKGQGLISQVDMSLAGRLDLGREGWQCELSSGALQSKSAQVLSGRARLGRLRKPGAPLVVEGELAMDLGWAWAQPPFAGFLEIKGGQMTGRFQGTFGEQSEFYVKADSTGIQVPGAPAEEARAFSAELRGSLDKDGLLHLKAPLQLGGGAGSDISISGTVRPFASPMSVDLDLLGRSVSLEDLKLLGIAFSRRPEPLSRLSPDRAPLHDRAPAWVACVGRVGVSIKQLQVEGGTVLEDFSATLRLRPDSLSLDAAHGSLAAGGQLSLDADVGYSDADQGYSLVGGLSLSGVDAVTLFGARRGALETMPLQGRFNLAARLASKGGTVPELLAHTTGRYTLLSKGGTCHLLRNDITEYLRQRARLAGLLPTGLGAYLGTRPAEAEAIRDRSKLDDYSSMALELSESLTTLSYDQFMIVIVQEADGTRRLEDLTFISPQLRATGGGQLRMTQGRNLLEAPFEITLQLYVRGRMAECLGKAGVLDGKTDGLGYSHLALPLKLGGTLSLPDVTELRSLLRRVVYAKASEELYKKNSEQSK